MDQTPMQAFALVAKIASAIFDLRSAPDDVRETALNLIATANSLATGNELIPVMAAVEAYIQEHGAYIPVDDAEVEAFATPVDVYSNDAQDAYTD